MAKTIIPSTSDDDATVVYPVFVDTNLETHLALIVSDTDTVSDLKMKIKLEHPRCFPAVGKVKVNSVQVKRRGHFYHLSNSMLVKNAFAGAKKSWYVYVDASTSEQQNLKQHIGKPDSSNQLALPWVAEDRYIDDDHQRTVYSDSNKRSGLEVQKYDAGSEGILSKKRIHDMQLDSSLERASGSGPSARKKRKTEKNESKGNALEKDKVLIYGTTDGTSKADATNQGTVCLEQGKSGNATPDGLFAGTMEDDHFSIISISGKKKKKNKKRKGNIILVKPLNQRVTVVPEVQVQETEEKRTFLENLETIHNHTDTVADVAVIPEQDTQQEELSDPSGFSTKEKRREPVQEVSEGIKAPFSTTSFSKHEEDEMEVFLNPLIKKLHELKKNDNHSAQNNIGYGDRVDLSEHNRDVLLSHDPEVRLPERRVFRVDTDVNHKEPFLTSKLSDPKGAMESENTVVKRKKRKTKKSSKRNEDESLLKDGSEGVNRVSISGPNPSFDGHLISETRKDGSILSHDIEKEISEKKTADSEKVISSEPEFSLPMESSKSQSGEDLSEKSRKKPDYLGGSKRKKNCAKMSATKNENESVVKHDNDAPYAIEKEEKISSRANTKEISEKKSIEKSHITAGREGDNLLKSGADLVLPTETNRGKLDKEDAIEASKECENANDTNRKKKKVKKSAARAEDAPIMRLGTDAVIESTLAVPNLTSDGLLIEKAQTDECVSFHMERRGLPEEKAVDAPQRVPDRGSDDVVEKEAETLLSSETNRSQERVKERSRSRRKKSQSSTTMSFHGFPTPAQEGEVGNLHQEYAPMMDKRIDKVIREVTGAAKSQTSGLEQNSRLELETEKSNGIENVSSFSQKISTDVCLSEVPPSPVIENIVEINTGCQVDVSNGVPGENHNEGAPTNKVKEARKAERLMKSKKNKEKVDVPSVVASHAQQKSLLSVNNHGDETSQSKLFTSTPLSVVEYNENVSFSKKSPEVSVMKPPKSHPVNQIKTPKMAGQSDAESVPRVVRSASAAKRNNGSLVGSSSNSESSVRSRRGIVNNKHDLSLDQSDLAVGKTTAKTNGDVVNNSQLVKSLLATPGAIFGDDSSNSSADDNGTVDSDASTRTPSDKSVSSESEDGSDSSMDSGRNGSDVSKGKTRRSYLVDSQSSDMNTKSFGEILRSSSRFKKAKLTASQYQEMLKILTLFQTVNQIRNKFYLSISMLDKLLTLRESGMNSFNTNQTV